MTGPDVYKSIPAVQNSSHTHTRFSDVGLLVMCLILNSPESETEVESIF